MKYDTEYAKYKNEIEKEYLLNIEIQKQNLKSLPNYENIPRKLDPITQEMIDDYNAQFRPMRDGKRYKYFKPEGEVILERIEDFVKDGKIEEPLSDDELKDYNGKLNKFQNQKQKLIKLHEIKSIELVGYPKKTKKSPEEMRPIIEQKQNDIRYISDQINDLEREISYYQNEITNNKQKKYDYDMLVSDINIRNQRKLNEYKKILSIFNESEIQLNQQPGESEQEYLDRLDNISKTEYTSPERAKLYNINEFKKNMKEIIFTEWKVENILKVLPITDIFTLNKTFPKFKKDIIDVFGVNNPNVSVDEYINLIKLHLSKANTLNLLGITASSSVDKSTGSDMYQTVDKSVGSDMYETVDKSVGSNKSMYETVDSVDESSSVKDEEIKINLLDKLQNTLQFKKGTKEVYFKINEVPVNKPIKNQPKTTPYVFYTYNPTQEFKDINDVKNKKNMPFKSRVEMILDNAGFNEIEKDTFIKKITVGVRPGVAGLVGLLKSFGLLYDTDYPIKQEGSGLKQKKKIIIKTGAKLKKVPTHCEFGKLVILLNKLYYSNMLSIKDKNNINVQGLPNTKVSDDFVTLIMKICSNKDITKNDIYNLNQKEIILYNILISKAGLSKKYEIDVKKTVKTLKDRLTLIEGEIVAGNNNNDLKKELYDVIFKLSNIGAIPLSSARKYYNDTIKTYF